jgi:hypothetical protein
MDGAADLRWSAEHASVVPQTRPTRCRGKLERAAIEQSTPRQKTLLSSHPDFTSDEKLFLCLLRQYILESAMSNDV